MTIKIYNLVPKKISKITEKLRELEGDGGEVDIMGRGSGGNSLVGFFEDTNNDIKRYWGVLNMSINDRKVDEVYRDIENIEITAEVVDIVDGLLERLNELRGRIKAEGIYDQRDLRNADEMEEMLPKMGEIVEKAVRGRFRGWLYLSKKWIYLSEEPMRGIFTDLVEGSGEGWYDHSFRKAEEGNGIEDVIFELARNQVDYDNKKSIEERKKVNVMICNAMRGRVSGKFWGDISLEYYYRMFQSVYRCHIVCKGKLINLGSFRDEVMGTAKERRVSGRDWLKIFEKVGVGRSDIYKARLEKTVGENKLGDEVVDRYLDDCNKIWGQ